ncbi:aluminum activated malate transporter-domain-containing protein [Blakeslea trispora]|nr:aluminum activated malate transporter-domain-containing protein [Blakeslea trispora]
MKKTIHYFIENKVLWKKIVKCVIAYEIATILILVPQFNSSAGIVPFLVVLGTIFFNASGAAGNQVVEMILNILFMIPSGIWCAIIKYLCVLYNRSIQSASLYSNGASIIASLGFLISVFTTAYLRLKYPRLFIPSLQAFVIPFFALTKGIYSEQFNIMSIVGIIYPTLMGGAIALLVNVALWPETAAKISEESFANALASISAVLDCIDAQIFRDNDVPFSDLSASKKLRQTIQKLDGDISKMQKSRKDAKYEIVISHYCPLWYNSLAHTLDGMLQNLYGLSLAVEREAQIVISQKLGTQLNQQRKPNSVDPLQRDKREFVFDNADVLMRQGSGYIPMDIDETDKRSDSNVTDTIGTLTGLEYRFISQLNSSIQPEIKQFVNISAHAMKCIRQRLEKHHAIHSKVQCVAQGMLNERNLQSALLKLDNAKMILQKGFEEHHSEPREDHYLIFTVLFSLTQFGKKLIELEKEADRLIKKRTTGRLPSIFFPRANLKKWLGQTDENLRMENSLTSHVLYEQQQELLQREETRKADLQRELTSKGRKSQQDEHSSSSTVYQREDKEHHSHSLRSRGGLNNRLSFESDWVDQDSEKIPLHNQPGRHIWTRWFYAISTWCRSDPFRYAVKFAITMELLALMAWLPIPGVNDLYNSNHGQWALLSAMVVINFTVGSTLTQCFYRVVATVVGALCGYLSLLASNRNANPYVLAVMVLIFQFPMWYILLGSKYPRIGFISLLTLAVIISTGYMDTYKEDLFAPVWKRTLTAIIAIVVVIIIDHLLWPVWARTTLRKHLSNLLIATGIQYSKVASLVCQENTRSFRYQYTLKDAEFNSKDLKRQYQMACQMLTLAEMEPRITKASFPIETYRELLNHEKNVLYWIDHLLKTQQFISEEVRKVIMNPLNSYRKELAAAVHLYMFTLGGSLRTKSSLPASLPSAEISRQILQRRQAQLWHENFETLAQLEVRDALREDKGNTLSDEDIEKQRQKRAAENQIYWQTYAAGTVEVITEQEAMGQLIAKLMGQHVFKAACKNWID